LDAITGFGLLFLSEAGPQIPWQSPGKEKPGPQWTRFLLAMQRDKVAAAGS